MEKYSKTSDIFKEYGGTHIMKTTDKHGTGLSFNIFYDIYQELNRDHNQELTAIARKMHGEETITEDSLQELDQIVEKINDANAWNKITLSNHNQNSELMNLALILSTKKGGINKILLNILIEYGTKNQWEKLNGKTTRKISNTELDKFIDLIKEYKIKKKEKKRVIIFFFINGEEGKTKILKFLYLFRYL